MFEINGNTYNIIITTLEKLREMYKLDFPDSKEVLVFGYCSYRDHKIYINSEMNEEEQLRALKHELGHCYLWNTSSSFESYDEEHICNIIADSYRFINKVVEENKDRFIDTRLKI